MSNFQTSIAITVASNIKSFISLEKLFFNYLGFFRLIFSELVQFLMLIIKKKMDVTHVN